MSENPKETDPFPGGRGPEGAQIFKALRSGREVMAAIRSYIGVAALGLATLDVSAAAVSQDIGVLTRMWTHATFGEGDVFFVGAAGAGACQAFWLRAADKGYKNLYAVLLTARVTGRPVLVYAHDNELWSGSGIPTCRVEAIDFAD